MLVMFVSLRPDGDGTSVLHSWGQGGCYRAEDFVLNVRFIYTSFLQLGIIELRSISLQYCYIAASHILLGINDQTSTMDTHST
jgi:hypothetical protein